MCCSILLLVLLGNFLSTRLFQSRLQSRNTDPHWDVVFQQDYNGYISHGTSDCPCPLRSSRKPVSICTPTKWMTSANIADNWPELLSWPAPVFGWRNKSSFRQTLKCLYYYKRRKPNFILFGAAPDRVEKLFNSHRIWNGRYAPSQAVSHINCNLSTESTSLLRHILLAVETDVPGLVVNFHSDDIVQQD